MAHSADITWLANTQAERPISSVGKSTFAQHDLGEPVEGLPRIMPAVIMSIGLWAMILFAVWEVVA